MLPVSRLYSFLDSKHGFNLHFFEAQKLIHDLVLTHAVQGEGFSYFREVFLSVMPIVFFLKPGESLGTYIDSEDPFFRLKIECNYAGHTRCLLLPEGFNQFPQFISGKVRITKHFPDGKTPYTSVINLDHIQSNEVLNQILNQSYQTNSKVIVSDVSDQSCMIAKLPSLNYNKITDETIDHEEYIKTHGTFLKKIFNSHSTDIETIVKDFEDHGLAYLGSRQVDFFCPCTIERMQENLWMMYGGDIEKIFEGKNQLDIQCDYCRKKYLLTPMNFTRPLPN